MEKSLLRRIANYVVVFLIFMVVRSPVLMFITGFLLGSTLYHLFPEYGQQAFHSVQAWATALVSNTRFLK